MYHHHSQQEEPPQPFSNRPRPFNHQEQAHQQQQQQHSHFQYPPIKDSRDTDMEPMNMDTDMYLDRTNGSGSGGFSSSPQPLSESQAGHKRVVLERVVLERVALDSSDYRHPDQMFSSSTSTATQQPQSSHSAMGRQAWMHESPSPQTRASHSGGVDGQGVPESAGSILASFGLSSQDLKVLSQYPEDQLTPDNLPYIIHDILSRKSNDQNIAASSSSSYSQSATHTVCETQPPPSCSHGSLGHRRSPEVSSMCIDYGHSSRTTIDYGHSSLPTISSSREAFIREPLSCENLSAAERKKLKRPPASSLPKQEMDVAPERWQFSPHPPVPNKHGDLDYRKSSITFHKSKRSPTAECPLPPRSRHSDLDYRRDSPKRSPSSEKQSDYSSSSKCPAPWSSLSKPRDDTKRLPTPSVVCDYSAESPKDWIDHVESVKHTESYRDLHNKRHKSKRSPTPERLLPPRSRHPDPDYRRDSPIRSPSSETQRDYSSSSRRPAPWSSVSKPRDDTKRLPTPSICDYSAESPKDWIDHVESVKHIESYRDLHNKRHKSKRSPTPERLLPPRSRHPDPDYRRDSPKRSPSSETRRDYSSSSWCPAPWSSLSKPRDDTKRLPTPSICDYSAESPKDWIDHVESVKHTESYRDLHNKRHKSKRSPTTECLLPPRSRHPDPDYRRDSPKRSPSSETQRDYSSSSRRPAPWSSLSKPRDDTKICDYSAEFPKDWIDHVESVKHTESYRDLHNNSFSADMTGGGEGGRGGGEEPPQLAQDKARLEEEYLSLMAELGEEPVPSSGGGGGHNDNQGGGGEGGNDSNNQPPPVEEHQFQDFPDLRDFVTVDEVGDANDFPNNPPTDAVAMDTTVTVDKVEEDRFQDFPDLRDFVTVDEVVDEVGDANDFPNSPPTDAVAMDTTVTVDKGSAAPVDLVSFEPLPSLMDTPTAPTTKLKDILKDPDYPVIFYRNGKVSGYRCKLCNIRVKTTDVAQPGNHYKGKKHKVNAFLRLSKEVNISAEPDGTIHTSQDERVKEVSTIHASQDERVEEVSTIHASQDERVEEVSTIHASQDERVKEVSTIHASQDERVEEVSTIHASQDEHVEKVSSGLHCKLCQCFLPKGAAAIKAHLTGKRHAKRLRQLDQERKPKAPRREQHSLGQDDIPTTRERSATPDDDSVTHKPPPSSTELKHISEGSPDDGKDTAEEEDFIPEDPDYPEILYTYSTVIVYHCKLCDVRVETTNEADLDRHVNGKQHNVKSLRSLYLVKKGDNLEDICRDQSIVAVDKNRCSPYHCKLCDIRMENATRLRDHMYGRKHNVLLIQSQSLRSLYLDKNTANLEDICRAESIAVDRKNPYTVSRCEMCKIFPKQCTKQGVYQHLNGHQHVTSLWNKMKRSFRKDQTAPRFSAHLEERHLQELYLEIEANLGKKYNRNAERDAMIYTSRDEHVEEHVSSKGKVSLQCKLCQCFLPKGAPINAHLTGKRHAVSLRQLEERRKEESLAEFEELHTRSFQLKCYFDAMKLKEGNADQNSSQDGAAGKELSGSHSQAEVEETENVEQMEVEEEKTAASVSVKRLMSDDKRREEEPMQKKQKTQADNPPPPFDPNSADDEISPEQEDNL